MLAAADQPGEAAAYAHQATIEATEVQRNANLIRLRKCAAEADPELQAKIEPLIKIYQNPPSDKIEDQAAKS